MEEGFDPSYSFKPPHQDFLCHAFANTLLYLDHRRTGFDIPLIPFAINAYGADLIKLRGGLDPENGAGETGDQLPAPPSASPARCFDMGRAVAQVLSATKW